MKSPSLWTTMSKEIFSMQNLVWILILAVIYIFSIDLLLNYQLLTTSVSDHFPIASLISLFFSLFVGSFTSMSAEPFSLTIFFLNALFVGLNVLLLTKSVIGMQTRGKAHLALGGATLFSIITAGCASCGLSLLSVLGLSATLVALPFHGQEVRYISLFLLILSSFYMLKKLHEAKYCKI